MLAAGCPAVTLDFTPIGRRSARTQPATARHHGTAAADAATIVPGVRQPGANPRADTGRAQARSPVSLRPRGVSAQHPRGHRAVVVLAADFPPDGCQRQPRGMAADPGRAGGGGGRKRPASTSHSARPSPTQRGNQAYTVDLCYAAWAEWPCTVGCRDRASICQPVTAGGAQSFCHEQHCCPHAGREFTWWLSAPPALPICLFLSLASLAWRCCVCGYLGCVRLLTRHSVCVPVVCAGLAVGKGSYGRC